MKKDYTHIALLIDRSGSMYTIKKDMEGGIEAFIETQKQEEGTCTITAAQFNDTYKILFERKPIEEVENIIIIPNGSTALIDSMSRLINEVGNDIDSLEEDEKPEKVLFITITDGEENSSREFTNEQLKELIKEQEDKYSWNFTYIGANQDAFANSSRFGGKMGNTLNYQATESGVKKMWDKLSDATSRYRSVDSQKLSSNSFNYTEDEQNNV